ncbi:hypothetical protein [Psychrobacter sp. I-STPA10]|uniref:hypothetical protein n=1 Tax=Psychrobacter sp. I-STPA10 TaxID=2585769 RepID=UPI001E3DAFA6|nr:hypothetical protein [Psychrobacter sp. I-STPA10]
MNIQPIVFNKEEALKAGGNGGAFFEGNTEQLVKIARAEFVTSKNTGGIGIEFDVFNKDGQKGYFTLWYQRADGSHIEGFYRTLQAIMGLCGATTLTPVQATIEKWDFNANKALPTPMIVANELMNKYFTGLFINTFELYDGNKKKKMELYRPFNQKRQSLQEQYDQAPPKEIEVLKDLMIKKSLEMEAEVDSKLAQPTGFNNNQRQHQQQQSNNVTYQRTPPNNNMPVNSSVSQPNQNQMNSAGNQSNGGFINDAPVDDDIPF